MVRRRAARGTNTGASERKAGAGRRDETLQRVLQRTPRTLGETSNSAPIARGTRLANPDVRTAPAEAPGRRRENEAIQECGGGAPLRAPAPGCERCGGRVGSGRQGEPQ